ncbi:MAG: hypothetical protein GY711_07000 [bacterium]|nr:hypothetical protein [bacterium]
MNEHRRKKKLPEGAEVDVTEVTGGRTQREISEQLRINELNGIENLESQRNPIGEARRHVLDQQE